MTNKCRTRMVQRELYNVRDLSLEREDGREEEAHIPLSALFNQLK